jgi:hypothetical protein
MRMVLMVGAASLVVCRGYESGQWSRQRVWLLVGAMSLDIGLGSGFGYWSGRWVGHWSRQRVWSLVGAAGLVIGRGSGSGRLDWAVGYVNGHGLGHGYQNP